MGAGLYKIDCEQGATFSQQFTYQNSDATPVDLTGFTARMQVRASKTDPTVLITLTTANGRITLGGVAGTVTLNITATDTALLVPGQYVYDLELVSGSYVDRMLEGNFIVDGEVTR